MVAVENFAGQLTRGSGEQSNPNPAALPIPCLLAEAGLPGQL